MQQFRFSLGSLRRDVQKSLSLKRNAVKFQAWRRFWRDLERYKASAPVDETYQIYACLNDWTTTTPVDPTYFYQDSWAFSRILQRRPDRHIDVGSHYKFVSLLAQVIPTTMVDIRPLPVTLNTLTFVEGSILSLPFDNDELDSVSSICVIEHIGLGRYNDPIDPAGTRKALSELKRVLAPGGRLQISVPIYDEDTTFFNAHRAFTESSIVALCEPLKVTDKQYIYGNQMHTQCQPGFGTNCLELEKPA